MQSKLPYCKTLRTISSNSEKVGREEKKREKNIIQLYNVTIFNSPFSP